MRNACLWVLPLNRLAVFYCVWMSAVYCTFSKNCQNLCTSNLEGEFGITNLCNVSDITAACTQGCQFWNATVQINCPLKCNKTYTRACETVSCKFGCSRAEDTYGVEAQNYLNKPSAPFASTIGSHNVTLGWKPANISGVNYIIQWKFKQLPGDWRYTEVVSETSYTVEDLQAFTEYVFRVVWIVTSQLQLHSPSSPSYRTHAFGAPATAPVIKDIQSSSPNTVEVSWSPPLFPNGLIVGYNLLLTSENHKLLGASRGHSFQFYSTFPNNTYRFSIVAVNEVGAGPPAEANITTPEFKVKEKATWLFLSRNRSLRKRYMEHFLEAAQCLQNDIIRHNITGISVNVYQQVVYFSEGNSIWVKGAANMSDVSDLMLFYAGWGNITSISVDWLYQRIYFVMNEKIHVCHLENCTAAEDITPLYVTSPRKVIADPYNGYIFCLLEDGIYRANLPLFPGTASTASPVVKSRALRDFTINFQSKRLIFFNKTDQAFVSGFLDGSEFHTLRSHVSLNDIESFVYENNVFTVTDGSAVFHEEVSPVGSSSFNEYVVDCNLANPDYFGFGNLLFYGASTQPFPLPTLPRLVTALFGLDQAVISWTPPEHAIGTSLSAWQNWTYDVKVSSQHPSEEEWVVSNISDTRFTVKELASFRAYEVSVRAVSPAGEGPWSESFRGTTLEEAEEDPYMLAVGDEGLWKQRLDSYGPGELLYHHIRNISDLDWYNDTLYWINSMGEVQTWSLNKREGTTENTYVSGIRNARMLAFDWLGQCLYWAGKANTIYRKSLLGGHVDIVAHVVFLVKDLVVDSVNGYLYWATMYSVESARLNGEEYLMFQQQLQFSGKQVVGLTLDLTYGFLYWLVQDSLCLNLYRISLCKEGCGNAIITEFAAWSTSEISQGALEYYSGRLFWINSLQFITTQEVNQSLSIPFSQPAEFAAFTLVHTSRKPLPGNFSFTPKVIPVSVPESSFRIKGNSSSFHITWSPSTNVEWGTVFYCVGSKTLQSLESERCLHPHNLTVPSYQVDWLEPFTLFDFTVTPYTYWGKAPTTSVLLRAPEGVPSAPTNPRIYVLQNNLHRSDEKVLVEFRWDRPERDNGVLTQFRVYYQLLSQNGTADTFTEWKARNVTPTLDFFSLGDVLPSLTVRFQVQAFTSVGPGALSDIAERNSSGKKIGSLTVDKKFIYWSIETKKYTEIHLANKESTSHFLQKREIHDLKILAYSSAAQLYPDKRCLILLPDTEKPTILATTNTSFVLSLPSVRPQQLCPGISLPTPTYLVFLKQMTNNHRNSSYHLSALWQKTLVFQDPIAVIDNLQPFSSYVIQVAAKNYYSNQEVLPMGKETIGTTLYGVPEAVDSIKTVVLSDTTINISWSEPLKPNGPPEYIRYQISVNLLPPVPSTPLRKSEFPNGTLAWSVSGLQSGTNNLFKVLAFHPNENWFSESVPVTAKTFETPPAPSNIVPRNTSFQLEWRAPSHVNETSFWFELRKWETKSDWVSPASTTCTADLVYTCNLTGTLPSSNYFVRVTVVYVTGLKSISSSTSFKTTAGVPSKPGVPKRAEDTKNSVQWEKADDNGSNLTYYILECRKQSDTTSKVKSLWKVVYNGSCASICTWKAKNLEGTFQFRAAAANVLGLGEYSDISKDIILGEDTMISPDTVIAIAVVIGVVVLGLTVAMLFGFVWHQQRTSRKQALPGQIVFIKEDKELAQLRGVAETVGLANACYAVSTLPSQAEIESLPAFPRDKLNLHKFLGSGAFGEVYEGTAVDILADGSGESKVAVKTLKKGATDHEKSEFLKEAHLMSKFDHPHILKLLGVCLLNEPQYLILELMEGGDLLSYLRGARKQKFQSPLLTVTDLLDICLDICKGCVYLEKMHFIHRDLAARNCLVSDKKYESSSRVVKIGDFGLARDIYKNDYYRKRGEGLLPVRWMAPESLMDGVFTNRSDVWAFGVLVWETLTLGQQPYPGFSNTQVLHHVRSGGRLETPNNCPDDLCDLMTRCWAQEPHNRPSFTYIQDKLQEIRHSPLCLHYLEDKESTAGVINEAFEDSDVPCADSDSILSTTLMETRNHEGLNYLVLVKEGNQEQESINSAELS
ncbi:proto-oncogene tyrosine-protein kinase ROS isoform X3 [Chroicocephalus ridibundus]|uniref:proto-oncogene tyrosine-protein kinase ROS isoform X3 n=1 Tax=Chroicocephalus ridibundus TaxID=1192867 RepID=UPI002FDD36A9